MRKIVINRRYGGFDLSDEAVEILEKEASEFFTYDLGESWLDLSELPRDDARLVRIVEELGERSWGRFAKLKIVEVPDDIEWIVQEYDGIEWVAEKHRRWS